MKTSARYEWQQAAGRMEAVLSRVDRIEERLESERQTEGTHAS